MKRTGNDTEIKDQTDMKSYLRIKDRTSMKSYPGGKGYTGIDIFRFVAAVLIVTIHTLPLTSFSETGDFILTRILARLSVPFFFMTSGFFLISRYGSSTKKRKAFVKKTAAIYGAAIALYLPLNLYNHYFAMENLLPNLIRDLVFDGTFYHLWYLPASILGGLIGWGLVKGLGYKKALAAALGLYAIGLFGDSYYGISEMTPGLKGFYGLLFQVSDYTRNGLFFAPLFFVLGGLIADKNRRIPFGKSMVRFALFFLLMTGEALVLHHFHMQRHDSMYLFLPLAMYFLFQTLLSFQGRRPAGLRNLALLVYLLHPMMIVAVRLLAKVTSLQGLLVENSLVHFLAVALLSTGCAIAGTALWSRIKPMCKKAEKWEREYSEGKDRAWIEVNLENLEHNVREIQRLVAPNCKIMAVVKREAYGHGGLEIASCLDKIGIRAFAAATIDEAILLRKCGIQGEILILGYTDIRRAAQLKKYRLTQTLVDAPYAMALSKKGISVQGHLKIDTGMHRLGMDWREVSRIKAVFSLPNIKVTGMYTHLCCPDSRRPEDIAFTKKQAERFFKLAAALENEGVILPKLHIQSTYGVLNYPEIKCDYVRIGIGLYGVLSTPDKNTRLKPDLRPVLSLKARVAVIQRVAEGESVGYGRTFVPRRDSRIAVVAIGYGDGLPRSLSCGRGRALIHGRTFPIVGRICMDCLFVDITEEEDIWVGDTVTLIGEGAFGTLAAPDIADSTGSISNELLCRLSSRLPIVTVE